MGKWILLLYLIVLAVFDWKEQKIPLILAGGGTVAALAVNICRILRGAENVRWLMASILLGMLPGLFMLAVACLTGKAGCGDGITLMSLGMLTDYKTCIVMWGFSLLLMSLISVGMLCVHRADRDTRLPYLPFLTIVYTVGIAF